MARYVMIARSNAVAGKEAEFNRWYDEQHMPDMMAIPGFVGFERFAAAGEGAHGYMNVLQLETDDLGATLAEMGRRTGTDQMPLTDAMDFATVDVTFWAPKAG